MYAPLAPYIVPTSDGYEQVKDRSPGLMHCIVYVFAHLSPFVREPTKSLTQRRCFSTFEGGQARRVQSETSVKTYEGDPAL